MNKNTLQIFQIDAFTSEIFKGNPACVMPLDNWLPDELLLKIAKENNVSETAFFIKKDDHFYLRFLIVAWDHYCYSFIINQFF